MKMGAAYIRVSTDDQLEYSLDSQLKEIRKYAKAHDIVLVDDYIFTEEEGRSGRSARRPEFQRMIGAAKTKPKPFDVVLVWKFSRFARNREDSVVYKSMLRKKYGIDVVSVSEPVGDDKMSMLIESMIEAMDEYYSVNLAEEVKRGMSEKASRGGVVASPPFGYIVHEKKYIPDPKEAEVVKMIFEKFVNEGMGYKPIATMLNAMGIRTKRGFPIENRTIKYIVENPVYIGKIRWSVSGRSNRDYAKNPNAIIVDGQHEPIISDELFAAAQERAAELLRMYPKHARIGNGKFMLQGLVRCSSCGSTLVRSNAGLQCHMYAKGACKVSHYISMDNINRRVIDLIEETFVKGDFSLDIRHKPEPTRTGTDLLQAKIEREKQKLERVKAAYADGIDTLEEYKANKERIMQTIADLERQDLPKSIDRAEAKRIFLARHADAVKSLRDPNILDAQKNDLLRTFVDRIIFDRTQNQLQLFFYL